MSAPVTRRAFLVSAGAAGAALTVRLPLVGPGTADAADAWDPNPAFTLTRDGIVTVHITKAEMGQGVGTALAQIVAEELEVEWKDVRIDYPTNDPKFGLMLTGGSWSVNWTFDTLSRVPRLTMTVGYDPRFSGGDYGVWVETSPDRAKAVAEILRKHGAAEVRHES